MIAFTRLSPMWSTLLGLLIAIALMLLNFWIYQSLNWVLPVASALMLLVCLFVLNMVWGYLFEYRKGRAMLNLFGEYVAPELVAIMASQPESYSMKGESRELTVLFADIRGFTNISEGLAPDALREYINLYLTAMSEDIRGNRGTLDKYIGDAVMAFWGAPVSLSDHAARAVGAALLMQASAKRLHQDFIARGLPPLKIGIGINTGQMRVGDMGSKIRRAYTVMGDAVNLASRLEAITKIYGAEVVVGEATKLAAPEFVYRELGYVVVKGKNEPVQVFEPLGLATDLDASIQSDLQQWHDALALMKLQKWDEVNVILGNLQRAHPDEKLYSLYLHRIAHYRAHLPTKDWDSVIIFDSSQA